MPAPTITALPAAPLRSMNSATFTSTAETFVDALEDLPGELNAFGDYLNTYVPSGAAPLVLTIEAVSGTSYTFASADSGKHKRFTNGSAITATVPKNATDAIPIGTRIRITQAGAGAITLTPEDGTVTLNSRDDALASAGQFAVLEIEKVATNEWDVLGDVA